MTRNTQLKIFYLLLITFVLTIGNSYGQKKQLEQVETNLYQFREIIDNEVHQTGYYKLIDGNFKRHSYWKDNLGTVAYFKNDKLIWIKPNGEKKYTYQEIEYHKMKAELARLRSIVALND
jgi:hypothetical protein